MRSRYYASCAFGTESCVRFEVTGAGGEDIETSDGRVYFTADENVLARVCISSRCADRVYMVLSRFTAVTFDELFENVKKIEFGDIIPRDAAIPVAGDAVHSVLGSVSDVQSVTKKAIIESMKRHYGDVEFSEVKKPFSVYVSIVHDEVTVALNMVGSGLSRRGYRLKNGTAPIKETLASSLIDIARWYSHPFYDPMCGSGTIVIEAAMRAKHIMPGEKRPFDCMHYGIDFKRAFDAEKQRARDGIIRKPDIKIFASDIDDKVLEMAEFHAGNAGVDDVIRFSVQPVSKFVLKTPSGVIITNPPYAVRMGERGETDELYRQMGRTFLKNPETKVFVICADEAFEHKFGRKADKKRKLSNAGLKTYYYQYFRKR